MGMRAGGMASSTAEAPVTSRPKAALYVRVSSASQSASAAAQEHYLRKYGQLHGFDVVHLYLDAARSGLTATGRQGLQQLLADAACGAAGFTVLLVYDVSRWGRYQDVDEAAFYEFVCNRAGIEVIYCAEALINDRAPLPQLMKNIKRGMAAEYSRELSEKVFLAQRRLATLGFKQGGKVGYGLRRLAVNADGFPLRYLSAGERKPNQTDRVRLAPGTSDEISVIREIFRLYTVVGLSIRAISRQLNTAGPDCRGHAWTPHRVGYILHDEAYRGVMVYNRQRSRLQTPAQRNPVSAWVRTENAHPSMVDAAAALKADRVRDMRQGRDTEAILAAINAVYQRHGTVSLALLATVPGMPRQRRLVSMFGSLQAAYTRAGVAAAHHHARALPAATQASMRFALVARAVAMAQLAGVQVATVPQAPLHLRVGRTCTVRITIAACRKRLTGARWRVALGGLGDTDFVLAGLLDENNATPVRYALIAKSGDERRAAYFGTGRYAKSRRVLFSTLAEVFGLPPSSEHP